MLLVTTLDFNKSADYLLISDRCISVEDSLILNVSDLIKLFVLSNHMDFLTLCILGRATGAILGFIGSELMFGRCRS